jgi:hypothetical protein
MHSIHHFRRRRRRFLCTIAGGGELRGLPFFDAFWLALRCVGSATMEAGPSTMEAGPSTMEAGPSTMEVVPSMMVAKRSLARRSSATRSMYVAASSDSTDGGL